MSNFDRMDDSAPVMRVVEESEMPTGLYGWEGFFCVLLTRKPDGGGTK